MKSRILEDDSSYPTPKGTSGWSYYHAYEGGQSYPIYYRQRDGVIEQLINVNEMAEGKINYVVTSVKCNPSGTILAYAVDESGNEKYNIHFVDLSNREVIHMIPDSMYANYEWFNDEVVFFTGHDAADRLNSLHRVNLVSGQVDDLMQEDDQLFSCGMHLSDNKETMLISVSSSDTSEYWICQGDGEAQLFKARENNVQYQIEPYGNWYLIKTNCDGATNFKMQYVSKDGGDWVDLMPYQEELYITGFQVFQNWLVLSARMDGQTQILYSSMAQFPQVDFQRMEFPEEIYCAESYSNYLFDVDRIRYIYTSPTQPYSLFEVNLSDQETVLLKQKQVPNYNADLYTTRLIQVPTADGNLVPVSMVYRKDLLEGPNRMLLYGYGSYSICIDGEFNYKIVSLLDRGFVFAVAHIRGGSEKGYTWYEDGKMANKMNTFTDFITCAEYLIEHGFTNKEKLGINGRSAGGLLMGAVMTLRPDLFQAVVAGVPFVDVLTTMADESIPLTCSEWIEWGNPNIEEQFNWMAQYSPYDLIGENAYPHLLMTCGLHDPRVQYWEPAKFVAKMRDLRADSGHTLLKCKMEHGHFDASDRYASLRETAMEYAFLMMCLEG